MTIMAAEAGAGAAEAEAGAATTAGRSTVRGRRGGRTSQGMGPRPTPGQGRFGPAGSAPGAGRTVRSGGRTQQGSRPARSGGRTQQGGGNVRPARSTSGTARNPQFKLPAAQADRSNYQNIVLAEFVAAVLLVAATPFAKKQADGLSPYAGKDLVQLVAVTLTYFLLALVSGASRGAGRFAAWFGLLILLTVGLGEAARLAKLFNVFGLQPSGSDAGGDPGEGTGGVEG